MLLPNGSRAIIAPEKLSQYLLAAAHPKGRGKADFFLRVGFSPDKPEALERFLRDIACDGPVVETDRTLYGMKYVVEHFVRMPNGRIVRLRTIWMIRVDERRPRFVTAYPTHSAWRAK